METKSKKILVSLGYSLILALALAFVFTFFIDCGGMITTKLDPNKPIFHNDADDYSFGTKYIFSLFLNLAWTPWLFLSRDFFGCNDDEYDNEYGEIKILKIALCITFIVATICVEPKLLQMSFWGCLIYLGVIGGILGTINRA